MLLKAEVEHDTDVFRLLQRYFPGRNRSKRKEKAVCCQAKITGELTHYGHSHATLLGPRYESPFSYLLREGELRHTHLLALFVLRTCSDDFWPIFLLPSRVELGRHIGSRRWGMIKPNNQSQKCLDCIWVRFFWLSLLVLLEKKKTQRDFYFDNFGLIMRITLVRASSPVGSQ